MVCTNVKEVLAAVGSLETLLDLSVSLEVDGSEVGVSVAAGPTNMVPDSAVDDSRGMGSVDAEEQLPLVAFRLVDTST